MEEIASKQGISRRSFLKTTAAAGAVALAGGTLSAAAEEYASGQIPAGDEKIYQGICRPNCFGYCPFNIHVRDGRIVKVSPGKHIDPYYNRGCLRGLSHVLRTYNPDRIGYPLRRKEGTERGAMQWERISWDEAINEVATKFVAYQKELGPSGVAFMNCSGNMSLLNGNMPGILKVLLNTANFASVDNAQDMALFHGMNRVTGAGHFFFDTNEAKDMVNSRVIMVWANNLTVATMHEWHSVAEAHEKGTKVITIDPQYTEIAAKSDIWVPIRHGADTALMLAMIKYVIDNNLTKEHTCAPFLVRSDTGMFLRMGDISGDTTDTTHAVWDEEVQDFVPAATSTAPALTGTFTAAGTVCRTAFDLLKESVKAYTPEYTETLTDIPAARILELADYATQQPVMHRIGYGAQAYGNGVHGGHAIVTLCSLLGNLGYPGAGFGSASSMPQYFNYAAMMPTGPATSPTIPTFEFRKAMRTGMYAGKPFACKAIMITLANPGCCGVNTNEWMEDVINRMEFIVTLDNVFTDTARYSDIILPPAGWFEVEDVTTMGQTYYYELNEKAIDPLYESKPDSEIYRMLAEKMGLGQYFQMSDEEYCDNVLAGFTTMAQMRKEKMVSFYGGSGPRKEPHITWSNMFFYTQSGRLEFYCESPVGRYDYGQEIDVERERLPRFFPPLEAWPDNPAIKKYPLILNSSRPKYRVHSQWFDNGYLREIEPEPIVYINPVDAEARAIANHDYVRVYNDRGQVVAKAIYSEAVKPGSMTYPKGWQMHQHKLGCWSELMSSDVDPVGVNSNFFDVLCEVETWKDGE